MTNIPPTPERKYLKSGLTACAVVAIAGLAFVISCATVDRVMVVPPAIPGAEYVGMDTCGACHEKEVQDFKLTAHARVVIPGEDDRTAGQGCESCHGAGSLHADAGGGYGVHIVNPGKDADACFQCHLETKMLFNLQYRHPVLEGRMSCNDCHDPHGANINQAAGTFISRVNDTCLQCHREQARPHVFQHEALREGCISCHAVHGSINDKMLTERDNNLCLKCHGQIGAPGSITIGDFNHTSRLAQGTCWSAGCHTAVHGSDINSHLRY